MAHLIISCEDVGLRVLIERLDVAQSLPVAVVFLAADFFSVGLHIRDSKYK